MMKSIHTIAMFFMIISGISSQLVISGGWDKDTIVIGDEAILTLSIETDNGVDILAVSSVFLDSVYSALASVKAQVDTSQPIIPKIADFELLNIGSWKDPGDDGLFAGEELNWNISQAGGKTLYENSFKFRLWDPGEIIAIYPPIIYFNNGVQDQFYQEGQMKIIVGPPGGITAQDTLGLADIKPIFTEAVKLSDYLIYFIIVGAALLFGFIYWIFVKYYKGKKKEQLIYQEPEVIVPAHEIALAKLSILKEKELWQNGNVKAYQSELTYIIREYLENRYEIQALESTTEEIVVMIQNQLMKGDVISLKRILQVADLVKFAKATPEAELHESFMNDALGFVNKTRINLEKEEEEE